MTRSPCHFVVLAAGEGTRMRSSLPKVLHPVAGEPMLGHVLGVIGAADPDASVSVVVGPGMDQVAGFALKRFPAAGIHIQHERRGTAHAVLAAREGLPVGADIVVLYGDAPLLVAGSIRRLRDTLAAGADVAVLGFEAADPAGYGRLILEGGRLAAIREDRDASVEERSISLCNSGVIAFRAGLVPELLEAIGTANAQGEYYLTDAVGLAVDRGLSTAVALCPEDEVQGVNTRAQLAAVEATMQARLRAAAMEGGATLIDPATVYFSLDTRIGRDVTIEPNVVFGPRVSVADGAVIHAFCHFENAEIGAGAHVGPFARLRPGARIGEGSKIGNFVEVKASEVRPGAKVNHLSYIGDTLVGEKANIGAGTITCNYDGFAKHRTEIGAGAFVGSNSSLVAPVTIGAGAYIASGSVITDDVSPDALALARGRQVEKPGWAATFRRIMTGGERTAGRRKA